MLDPASQYRLRQLAAGPLTAPRLIEDFYGIDINEGRLQGAIRSWLSRMGKGPQAFESRNQFDRFTLESFFQSQGLLPRKRAAYHWAMEVEQFGPSTLAGVADAEAHLRGLPAPSLLHAPAIQLPLAA